MVGDSQSRVSRVHSHVPKDRRYVRLKPDEWQQVKKILDAALDCPPAQRATFLDQACAGCETLRREAESLIAAAEEVGEFIEEPLCSLRPEPMRRLGPYQDRAPDRPRRQSERLAETPSPTSPRK